MAGRRAKLSVSQETRILREKRSRRKLLKNNLFSETGTKVGERFLKTFFLNASEATTTTTTAKMKPMSIACAVTVIIACVCVSQSAAVPFSEPEVRFEEPVESAAVQSLDQGEAATSEKETSPEVLFRTKRQSHLSLCRYCCNCCKNKGCGFCCRF